jgi:hypothetical protein
MCKGCGFVGSIDKKINIGIKPSEITTGLNSIFRLTEEQSLLLKKEFEERAKQEAEKMSLQLSKTLDNVISKIDETGWTLPTQMALYPINVLGRTDKIKDVNEFFYWYFTENENYNFKKLIEDILDTKIDEKYKRAVDECVYAYYNSKYIICSITLLTVIEGILSRFYPDKTNTKMMKVCQKQVDTIDGNKDIIKKYVWISYNNFIRKLYKKSNFDSEEPSFINRHWILHGRSEYNLTDIDCIRLFNAVSSICCIVGMEGK